MNAPFELPDRAGELTDNERAIVLGVVDALLERKADDEKDTARVYRLNDFRAARPRTS